jgi:hypothetical protein
MEDKHLLIKETLIKEAYGESYNKLTIDENGYVNIGFSCNGDDDVQDILNDYDIKLTLSDLDIKNSNPYGEDGIIIFRPKSLTGIETNNGWIKIDNEEQYNELFNDLYEWYNIKKKESWIGDLEYYGKATHYRIIQPNKPPIY